MKLSTKQASHLAILAVAIMFSPNMNAGKISVKLNRYCYFLFMAPQPFEGAKVAWENRLPKNNFYG